MTPVLSQVLTISVNDEPENLAILPPQDESIKDKAIIYLVDKLPMPMPTDTWEEEQAFWKVLEREAPAFIFDLLNKTTVPREWQDSRYGVLAYHHAEILDVLAQMGEEQSLLEIIDIELFEQPSRDEPLVDLTAIKIQQMLFDDDSRVKTIAQKLLYWNGACGTYLGRLQKSHPHRISYRKTNSQRLWSINPPDHVKRGTRGAL